ncbi:MAG: TRAP transporter small permease subunit [Burkholderiaceae bacterium]
MLIRIERFIALIGSVAAIILLPALILARVSEIVLRGAFNKITGPFNALEAELLLMFIFLALGAAYLRDAHVRVDVMSSHLSERVRALIEVLGALFLVLPFGLIVLWYGVDMTATVFGAGERAVFALGAGARWIVVGTVPLGIGLVCLGVMVRMFRQLGILFGRRGPGEGSGPVEGPTRGRRVSADTGARPLERRA